MRPTPYPDRYYLDAGAGVGYKANSNQHWWVLHVAYSPLLEEQGALSCRTFGIPYIWRAVDVCCTLHFAKLHAAWRTGI